MNTSGRSTSALIVLLALVSALSIFGLVMLYSTTAATFGEQKLKAQCVWILAGICCAFVIHKIDYRTVGAYSHLILLAVGLPLLYLAAIHIMWRMGVSKSLIAEFPLVGDGATKGAFRWLKFGNRTIQPSEFAKIAILIFLARYYGTCPPYNNTFKRGVLIPMASAGAVVGLILLGGSLSATVITGSIVVAVCFVAGVRLRYLLVPLALGCVVVATVVKYNPERASRLTTFRNPEKTKESSGYQLYLSQLALGSGHWHGMGFNQSRMKENYLPEAHTDFIMAIVGEELGFVGIMAVLTGYLFLVGVIFLVAGLAADREGMILAYGIGCSIGLHSLINIGVVSGFLPTTGVTAPLISYGGSNMLMTWICIGFLANILRISQMATEDAERDQHWSTSHQPALVGVDGLAMLR